MEQIKQAVAGAVQSLFNVAPIVELSRPDEQFGDYATNVALKLGNQLKQNPREVADAIARQISHPSILKTEVAGPGFINLWLTDKALIASLFDTSARPLAGKKILAEYSDPNPFKPLHAGHLYTTIVGDSISRLIDASGADTVRLNYGGDVGLHVGKSMWAIIKHLGGDFPDKLIEIPVGDRPKWLGERYVEGNNAYEDDETARVEIINVNKGVYDIHSKGDHDSPFAQIYWTCRLWSYDYFQELYEQLQVMPFDRYIPESEVADLGLQTVRREQSHGVFELSDGAVIFDGDKYGLHSRVFINSEGLPTYETKDVGLSLTKWQDYQFDSSIIITANEQAQYMQVVLKALEQFAPEPAKRTTHLTHGFVKLQHGVKMSSRTGNVVTALDILEAVRSAGKASGVSHNEASILAAVKYAFLKNRIGGDIIYDPAESVALEGNSGPYLQYAHARARSILSKSGYRVEGLGSSNPTLIPDPFNLDYNERSLTRIISMFNEVVLLATDELMPHHICTYLYELAQSFNRFYEKNRVIGDERESIRLGLVQIYADTLKSGLGLLGIEAPDTM
jgi:arginyl-tRNA synthetase